MEAIRVSNNDVIATGSVNKNGLYELDVFDLAHCSNETSLIASLQVWHGRLAHVESQGILNMASKDIVKGLKISSNEMSTCSGCLQGKGHRSPIPKTKTRSTNLILELVHTDMMGPFEVKSLGGSSYVITFIDDYSKWTTAYAVKRKSEGLECFKRFKNHAENHHNTKLCELRPLMHSSKEKNGSMMNA